MRHCRHYHNTFQCHFGAIEQPPKRARKRWKLKVGECVIQDFVARFIRTTKRCTSISDKDNQGDAQRESTLTNGSAKPKPISFPKTRVDMPLNHSSSSMQLFIPNHLFHSVPPSWARASALSVPEWVSSSTQRLEPLAMP